MARKKLKSIFTKDLNTCYVTGSHDVCIHHVFYGNKCRNWSEEYGYIVPITPRIHELVHEMPNCGFDLTFKQHCQKHFEKHHGSRDKFISIFFKSYL